MSELAPTRLNAGPLELLFEPGMLFARQLKIGETEVLRGIYPAVRDECWGTWKPAVRLVEQQVEADWFRLRLEALYQDNGAFFKWDVVLSGSADGRVEFLAEGEALRSFRTSRTGFCVLHADTVAGSPCTVEHTDGQKEENAFPAEISPHQPFFDVRSISHSPLPGIRIEVLMEGDTFEMEDQRNWTDASFKTYCRPLAMPTPYELAKGERVIQKVTVRVSGQPALQPRPSQGNACDLIVDGPFRTGPRLGLQFTSSGRLDTDAAARLQAVAPDHLRAELKGPTAAQQELLEAALEAARQLGSSLVLCVEPVDRADLAALVAQLDAHGTKDVLWMPFEAGNPVTTGEAWDAVREVLQKHGRADQMACGSRANFAEFNRQKPVLAGAAVAACAVNPQVHAFDNASIIETLLVQPVVVEQIRAMSNGLPVWISPLTLKRDDDAEDTRLHEPFGAAWTLGALAAIASAGAERVTLHGTTGGEGILGEDARSTPVFELLAGLASLHEPQWAVVRERDSGIACGLLIRHAAGYRLLLANLSGKPRTLHPGGDLPAGVGLLQGVQVSPYSIFQRDIPL